MKTSNATSHEPYPGSVNWKRLLQLLLALTIAALAPFITLTAQAKQDTPRAHPSLLQLAAEHPDETFLVIIQREVKRKNHAGEAPETAVEQVGGRVRKPLRMIESFSAELTGKRIEQLARHPKVRWITFDAPLISTAAGDPMVRDEFTTATYGNNDGTQTWAGPWTETGDDGSPYSGHVTISSGWLRLRGGSNMLTRAANLAGTIDATLSFTYRRNSLENGDFIAIQVSADDGGAWTELARFEGPGSDFTWQSASFSIAEQATAGTQIRLVTSSSMSAYDDLFVDNIQIEYALPALSNFVDDVRAPEVWQQSPSLQGQGVTVAVVDSGIASHADLQGRILVHNNQTDAADANDDNAHGTHVAGIIGGNGTSSNGTHTGVAPQVNLINVKVSNDQGVATTSDLVDGLQWILDNRAAYNIRVVNISLNSAVPESYHTSPLNAAVEILWLNGIVVVVSAGNNGTGSGPVPLYAPANDPFVITVGATDDLGTPGQPDDDIVATFSAYGTTSDGFTKPDLVAPGRNIISLLASTSARSYLDHPAHRVDDAHFRMSGTSMSAPVVSGAVALLLQDEPHLTPDQVKYRLMATANRSWDGFDASRAGAGFLDVYAAVTGTTTESANTGLSVSQLLTTGSDPVDSTVNWGSVNWGSVNWGSVNWGSVNWGSVNWGSSVWDD